MPRKVPLMSDLQIKTYEKLHKKDIYYKDIKGSEAQSLKSLVNRGLAKVHELDPNGNYWKYTYWTLS